MTTPTSHLPHLMKLAQIVTTSTPTHAAANGWPLFADQGADSPLSEIENTESPAQSINIEVCVCSIYQKCTQFLIIISIFYEIMNWFKKYIKTKK